MAKSPHYFMNHRLQKAKQVYNKYGCRTLAYKTISSSTSNIYNYHRSFLKKHVWDLQPAGPAKFEFNLINVSPEDIIYTNDYPFPVTGDHAIYGNYSGGWDCKNKKKITNSYVYLTIHQLYVDDYEWKKTDGYQHHLKKTSDPISPWYNSNKKEIKDWFKNLDELYNRVRQKGYKSQKQLYQDRYLKEYHNVNVGEIYLPDEIRVVVDRDGNIIHCAGGRHRLCIAKILELDTVPVVVQLIHRKADLDDPEVIAAAKK